MSGEKEAGTLRRVSTEELNRRWQAVRTAMKDAGMDFLLIENAASFFPGHVRCLQKVSLDLMKPGIRPIELFDANNEFLRSHGYPEQNALYGHGQGYDIAERPGLDPYEKMRIQARMNIAVHPLIMSERAVGWVCENYVVSESGTNKCLHKTPQKIFAL